jgi:hypothetical protein
VCGPHCRSLFDYHRRVALLLAIVHEQYVDGMSEEFEVPYTIHLFCFLSVVLPLSRATVAFDDTRTPPVPPPTFFSAQQMNERV